MRVQFTVNDEERLKLESLAKKNGYPDISSYCKDKSLEERTYAKMWEIIKTKISEKNSGDEFSLRELIDAPPSNLGVKVFNNQDNLGIEVLQKKDSLKANKFRKKQLMIRHPARVSFFMPIFRKGGVKVTNRIKGITVEIDGDTTGLNKALNEADKQEKIQLENGKLEQDKYDALQKEIIETENNLKALEEEAGDKIKKVGDKTPEVGKSLSTHVTAGAATGEVNTRFGLTSQKLEELSGKFIKFAQLNNINVSTTIDNTQE